MNPRCGFPHYSLSRGAPSATWVLLQAEYKRSYVSTHPAESFSGGESGIRTHGSFESPVFKTGSLNHSDISPRPISDQMQQLYYHIKAQLSTAKVQKCKKTVRSSVLSIRTACFSLAPATPRSMVYNSRYCWSKPGGGR